MDGIAQKMNPGEPNLGNMYERSFAEVAGSGIRILPQSLQESLEELRGDDVIKAALGPIADEFIDIKTREWQACEQQITPWELNQYLTFF